MKTLALVPARSGSKGVPGKNTRDFCGRPLMAWAIQIGRLTCDETYVSTDDPNIGLLASQYGAKVIVRPAELATDEAPMLPVIQHALAALEGTFEPDVVVLLQPTQPLRTAEHVRRAMTLLTDDWDSVVSVVESVSPDLISMIYAGRLILPSEVTRRQDARPGYVRDGTVYVIRREAIDEGTLYGDCRAMVIPAGESVNIDTEEDWRQAERMAQEMVNG